MSINYETIMEEKLLRIKDDLGGYDWPRLLAKQPQHIAHCDLKSFTIRGQKDILKAYRKRSVLYKNTLKKETV